MIPGITAQRTRARWTPAVLYAKYGARGFAVALDDMSTLYTDVARTTPMPGSGNGIGSATDLSGLGNHPFQSTSTARPIYNGNGATFSVDDSLVTPVIDFTGTDKMTVVMSGKSDSSALMFFLCGASGGDGRFDIYHNSGSSLGSDLFLGSNTSNSTPLASGETVVITAQFDFAGATAADRTKFRINGVAPSQAPAGTVTAGNFAAQAITLGALPGGGFHLTGDEIRVGLIGAALSAEDLALFEAWAAEPTTVVLP